MFMNRAHLRFTGFLMVGLFCLPVMAFVPIGPTTADMEKGQSEFGIEYAYGKTSLDFGEGVGSSGALPGFDVKEFETQIVTGKLSYGLTDDIDVFARFGGAEAETDDNSENYDADGIVFGFGANWTFYREDNVTWGTQFQANWLQVDGDWTGSGFDGDADVDLMELKVAAGPAIELENDICLFGGPYLHFVDGEKRWCEGATWERYEADAGAMCGGYIGILMEYGNSNIRLEYQMNENDDLLGLNWNWAF